MSRPTSTNREVFTKCISFGISHQSQHESGDKKGIGEQAANLLGSLLVSHMQLVAMERRTLPPSRRVPFFVHIDEFRTFSSEAFASLLSEARKFATHFCLANRYTDQLSNAVRAAVIGNAGTLIVFRVGSRDAEPLTPEFRPMDPAGLADQEPLTAWLRRGIGRAGSRWRISCMSRLVSPKSYTSLSIDCCRSRELRSPASRRFLFPTRKSRRSSIYNHTVGCFALGE